MVLIIIYVIVVIAAVILNGIILKYLNKKPLGKQTLIDPMIKDLIVLGFGAMATSAQPIFGLGLPLKENVALAFIFAQIFANNAWFIQNITLITTKYLSIFHAGLMASLSISDGKFVKIIRIGNFLIASLFLAYEVLTHDFKRGPAFKYLVGKPDPTAKMLPLPTVKLVLFTNIIAMAISQVKIAHYKRQGQHRRSGRTYSLKTLRLVAFIAAIVGLISLVRMTGFVLYDFTKITLQQVYHILATSALFNVLPAIFIWKNKNTKKFAIKQMRTACDWS